MAISPYITHPPGQKDPLVQYRLRIRTKVEGLDGIKVPYTVDELHPTRKAALEAQEIRWAEIREGKISKELAVAIDRAAEPTVADLLSAYKTKYTEIKAESSKKTEKGRLDKTIPNVWIPFGSTPPPEGLFGPMFKSVQTLGRHYARFGDLRVSACDKKMLLDYIAMREKKVKSETIRRELVLISCAFERFSDIYSGRSATNPVAMLRDEEKPAASEHRERVLTDNEEQILFAAADAASNPEVTLAFRLALGSAMRQGEIYGLHWEMIDWKARTANLGTKHKTARAAKTKGKKPKKRIIFLLPTAFDPLAEKWEAAGKPLTGRVISSYTTQGLKTAIRRVLEKASLDDFCFHDLRHTVITRLAAAGLSSIQIAKTQGIADARHLEEIAFGTVQAANISEKIEAGETLSTKELMAISGHSSHAMLSVYANIKGSSEVALPTEGSSQTIGASIRVKREGEGRFVASIDTPEGRLEAEGATPKEARELLSELL